MPNIYFGFALWLLFNGTVTCYLFGAAWMALLLGRTYCYCLHYIYFCRTLRFSEPALYWLCSILFDDATFALYGFTATNGSTTQRRQQTYCSFGITVSLIWIYTYGNWRRTRNGDVDKVCYIFDWKSCLRYHWHFLIPVNGPRILTYLYGAKAICFIDLITVFLRCESELLYSTLAIDCYFYGALYLKPIRPRQGGSISNRWHARLFANISILIAEALRFTPIANPLTRRLYVNTCLVKASTIHPHSVNTTTT